LGGSKTDHNVASPGVKNNNNNNNKPLSKPAIELYAQQEIQGQPSRYAVNTLEGYIPGIMGDFHRLSFVYVNMRTHKNDESRPGRTRTQQKREQVHEARFIYLLRVSIALLDGECSSFSALGSSCFGRMLIVGTKLGPTFT